jgi:hypothetical protein
VLPASFLNARLDELFVVRLADNADKVPTPRRWPVTNRVGFATLESQAAAGGCNTNRRNGGRLDHALAFGKSRNFGTRADGIIQLRAPMGENQPKQYRLTDPQRTVRWIVRRERVRRLIRSLRVRIMAVVTALF